MTNQNDSSTHSRNRIRTVLIAILCIAAFSACAYLAVDRFFVPFLAYRSANELMQSGSADEAASIYESLDGFWDSEVKLDTCYAQHTQALLDEGEFEAAGQTYAKIKDSANPTAQQLTKAAEQKADEYFARSNFEKAHGYYSAIGLSDRAVECVESLYNQLTSTCDSVCGVPSGFDAPMLRGYKDSDKYALAFEIESSPWETEDEIAQNIKLCYELGDFLNTAERGFAPQRLFDHKYSNDDGYYFMDEFGDWKYNLPSYRLPGYYGLYTKITDGVLYIGSDEKQSWTKQFRFEFSDMDNTLKVYSYAANRTYTLTKEY